MTTKQTDPPTPLSIAKWAVSPEGKENARLIHMHHYPRVAERWVRHYETCFRTLILMLEAEAKKAKRKKGAK